MASRGVAPGVGNRPQVARISPFPPYSEPFVCLRRRVDLTASRWYLWRARSKVGFQTILTRCQLCRDWCGLNAAGSTRARHPVGWRRTLQVAGVVAVLGAVIGFVGCQDVNPNLGVAPTPVSNITFISPSAKVAGAAA